MTRCRALLATAAVASPTGWLLVSALGDAIVRVRWAAEAGEGADRDPADHPLLAQACVELAEYFAGTRRDFDLPLAPAGGPLQQAVCRAMRAIPFGKTRTYGDIARELGVAAQPIGQACGANPIPVLIPCHRVVAADGKLGGFSGGAGVETKLALLRHEGALLI